MLVDSHCHIDFAELDERPALIDRARAATVASQRTIASTGRGAPTAEREEGAHPPRFVQVADADDGDREGDSEGDH